MVNKLKGACKIVDEFWEIKRDAFPESILEKGAMGYDTALTRSNPFGGRAEQVYQRYFLATSYGVDSGVQKRKGDKGYFDTLYSMFTIKDAVVSHPVLNVLEKVRAERAQSEEEYATARDLYRILKSFQEMTAIAAGPNYAEFNIYAYKREAFYEELFELVDGMRIAMSFDNNYVEVRVKTGELSKLTLFQALERFSGILDIAKAKLDVESWLPLQSFYDLFWAYSKGRVQRKPLNEIRGLKDKTLTRMEKIAERLGARVPSTESRSAAYAKSLATLTPEVDDAYKKLVVMEEALRKNPVDRLLIDEWQRFKSVDPKLARENQPFMNLVLAVHYAFDFHQGQVLFEGHYVPLPEALDKLNAWRQAMTKIPMHSLDRSMSAAHQVDMGL